MRKKTRRRHLTALAVLAAAAAAALLFFGLFYVTDVEVIGNVRYTEQQIKDMALQGPLSVNSILMSSFRKSIHPEASFIESIDVEYRSRNKLRLTAHEKFPIGYLQSEGNQYYFDRDGIVLEIIEAGEEAADKTAAAAQDQSEQEPEILARSGEGQEETSTDNPFEAAGKDPAETGNTGADTAFRPALTDVPLITGLSGEGLKAGDRIQAEDSSVFSAILSLTKLVDKFSIQPDYVELDESYNMTLYYKTVRIALGKDELLDEKVSRAAAILPDLSGRSGVLHLEEFTQETQNIIFTEDSPKNS